MDDCWYVNCYSIDSNITTVDSGPADVVMGERKMMAVGMFTLFVTIVGFCRVTLESRFLHHALPPSRFVATNTFIHK